jgi:hypothetical protein
MHYIYNNDSSRFTLLNNNLTHETWFSQIAAKRGLIEYLSCILSLKFFNFYN